MEAAALRELPSRAWEPDGFADGFAVPPSPEAKRPPRADKACRPGGPFISLEHDWKRHACGACPGRCTCALEICVDCGATRSVPGFEPSFRTSAPALAASRTGAALAKRCFISSWGRPQAASGLTLAELPHDALTSILVHCHETTLIIAKASCSTLRKACRAVLPAKLRARWPDRPHGRWTIAHDAHVFQEVALARDAWVNAMFDDYEANLSGGANFDRLEELQEENRAVFVAALDYWEVNGLTTKGYVRPFKGRVFDDLLICCFPSVSHDTEHFAAVMSGIETWVNDDDAVRLLDESVEPFGGDDWIRKRTRSASVIWTTLTSMQRAAKILALDLHGAECAEIFANQLVIDVCEERVTEEKAATLLQKIHIHLVDEVADAFSQTYWERMNEDE